MHSRRTDNSQCLSFQGVQDRAVNTLQNNMHRAITDTYHTSQNANSLCMYKKSTLLNTQDFLQEQLLPQQVHVLSFCLHYTFRQWSKQILLYYPWHSSEYTSQCSYSYISQTSIPQIIFNYSWQTPAAVHSSITFLCADTCHMLNMCLIETRNK